VKHFPSMSLSWSGFGLVLTIFNEGAYLTSKSIFHQDPQFILVRL